MNPRRILAIAMKNLRGLKHDRRTVGFLVFMPLLLITIFGYTFGGDVENLDVEIVSFDDAPEGTSIASAITSDLATRDTMSIVRVTSPSEATDGTVQAALDKVRDADLLALIVFEQGFTEDAYEALFALRNGTLVMPGSFRVYIDGTNPNIVSAMMNDLQTSIQKVLVSPSFAIVLPIVATPELVYGEGAEFIDFFAPGVMGLAAMMVTFMLSIISFVHERGQSTLDRLLASPATEGEIVSGYVLAFGLVGLIQSLVILITAILLFGIEIQGSAVLALSMIFVFGIGMQGLGFVLSALARNEFQAVQFMPIVLFPSILLSGVFWPLEAVPDVLRPASYFLPLTYAVEGLRSVMIRGWGVGDVWLQLVVLLVFAAVMMLLSTYGLKKRR
ncbi:MAG: ABC transporter permease [Candidatus Thermoplasmatota archaeon]|nr:ABC transporter permease [Candidatus Thermoplasmatota archaeon]